jgi:hypothetical protein
VSRKKRERNEQAKFRRSSPHRPPISVQTDGFVAPGEMPNDEQHPGLICRQIPQSVHVDLFALDPSDTPTPLAIPVGEKTLVVTYRLCPSCYQAKPGPWKVRLLVLERLQARVEGQ